MNGMVWFLHKKKEMLALAFFQEMREFFTAYAKSERCRKEFGKDLLFCICALKEGSKKEFYMPILEWLLSLNISLDVKDRKGKSPFEVCKENGRWDIYAKLNLSQMGDSLKGNFVFYKSFALCN